MEVKSPAHEIIPTTMTGNCEPSCYFGSPGLRRGGRILRKNQCCRKWLHTHQTIPFCSGLWIMKEWENFFSTILPITVLEKSIFTLPQPTTDSYIKTEKPRFYYNQLELKYAQRESVKATELLNTTAFLTQTRTEN